MDEHVNVLATKIHNKSVLRLMFSRKKIVENSKNNVKTDINNKFSKRVAKRRLQELRDAYDLYKYRTQHDKVDVELHDAVISLIEQDKDFYTAFARGAKTQTLEEFKECIDAFEGLFNDFVAGNTENVTSEISEPTNVAEEKVDKKLQTYIKNETKQIEKILAEAEKTLSPEDMALLKSYYGNYLEKLNTVKTYDKTELEHLKEYAVMASLVQRNLVDLQSFQEKIGTTGLNELYAEFLEQIKQSDDKDKNYAEFTEHLNKITDDSRFLYSAIGKIEEHAKTKEDMDALVDLINQIADAQNNNSEEKEKELIEQFDNYIAKISEKQEEIPVRPIEKIPEEKPEEIKTQDNGITIAFDITKLPDEIRKLYEEQSRKGLDAIKNGNDELAKQCGEVQAAILKTAEVMQSSSKVTTPVVAENTPKQTFAQVGGEIDQRFKQLSLEIDKAIAAGDKETALEKTREMKIMRDTLNAAGFNLDNKREERVSEHKENVKEGTKKAVNRIANELKTEQDLSNTLADIKRILITASGMGKKANFATPEELIEVIRNNPQRAIFINLDEIKTTIEAIKDKQELYIARKESEEKMKSKLQDNVVPMNSEEERLEALKGAATTFFGDADNLDENVAKEFEEDNERRIANIEPAGDIVAEIPSNSISQPEPEVKGRTR